MPLSDIPGISMNASLPQVNDYLIMLRRRLNDFLNHLDTLNVDELDASVILAQTITADKMNVTQLSAISADLGTITAGTVTGATLRTAASGARIELSSNQLKTFDSSGKNRGPSWGDLFGPNFGDVGFFDAGVQTMLLKCLGSGTGWQIMPDSGADLNLGASGANTYGYGNWNLPSTTGIGNVTSTEIGYVHGVTSGIQSQLDGKASSFSGYNGSVTVVTSVDFAASTVTTSTLNFSNGILTSVT